MSVKDKRYQVWFVPTSKGKEAFGWTETLYGSQEPLTADEASYEAYLANLEQSAPDAHEYGSYKAREITTE